MANEIQVDPIELRKRAESVGNIYTSIRNSMYSAKAQIDGLKGIWTGDGATQYMQSFQALMDKCSENLEIIKRMENALYETADTYEKNEKAVKDKGSQLKKLPTGGMR
ncbi:MAG: WXG100 family type VII secretion target [Lachnospiraceae bacterium]|nr:WXG100 family type VII secretion target [Lachnospiraceae bacterium]